MVLSCIFGNDWRPGFAALFFAGLHFGMDAWWAYPYTDRTFNMWMIAETLAFLGEMLLVYKLMHRQFGGSHQPNNQQHQQPAHFNPNMFAGNLNPGGQNNNNAGNLMSRTNPIMKFIIFGIGSWLFCDFFIRFYRHNFHWDYFKNLRLLERQLGENLSAAMKAKAISTMDWSAAVNMSLYNSSSMFNTSAMSPSDWVRVDFNLYSAAPKSFLFTSFTQLRVLIWLMTDFLTLNRSNSFADHPKVYHVLADDSYLLVWTVFSVMGSSVIHVRFSTLHQINIMEWNQYVWDVADWNKVPTWIKLKASNNRPLAG